MLRKNHLPCPYGALYLSCSTAAVLDYWVWKMCFIWCSPLLGPGAKCVSPSKWERKYGCMELPNLKIGNLLVVRLPFGVAHDAGLQICSQYGAQDRCRAAPWWFPYVNAIENRREAAIQDIAATDHLNAAQLGLKLVVPDDISGATGHQSAAQVNVPIVEERVVPGDRTGAQFEEIIEGISAQVDVAVAEPVVPDDQTGAKNRLATETRVENSRNVSSAPGSSDEMENNASDGTKTSVSYDQTEVGSFDIIATRIASKIKAFKEMLPTFTNMSEMIIDRQEIASGSYGRVYMTTTKMAEIAVKTLKTEKMDTLTPGEVDMYVNQLYEEAHLLYGLSHPNILTFYMMIPEFENDFPGMATELMSESSLYNCLQRGDQRVRSWFGVLNVAQQVVEAMMYLHERSIVHFDLKSCNILVEYDRLSPNFPICKVGDFGSAMVHKRQPHDNGRIPIISYRGTVNYMAPEVIVAKYRPNQITFVTEKVDVYSFGMLMWELVSGMPPYRGMSSEEVEYGVVQEGMRPHVPKRCIWGWEGLMRDCWAEDEDQRPSFQEIRDRLNDIILQYNRNISMNRRLDISRPF